ncbi:MAG: pyridoxal phosphate-dependent aminotransferase [Clostridiales bacterium]|nr:pyridoxal phosphate-dependent aminotransferase [Clostridiales bacterium]
MINKAMQKLGEERSVIREIFEYGNARKKQIGRENVFDFSIGNPNVPAPACVQNEIARLLSEMPAEELHGYSSAAGLPEVREAVAKYISGFGVNMRADLVYMTCGAAASLSVALSGLLNAGDEVIVLAPFFPEYKVFIEHAGGVMKQANTNEEFHLALTEIDRAITQRTKAIIINSPNNPTGAVYNKEELKALAALLTKRSKERNTRIFLIADEPYRELVYGADVPYAMNFYADTVVCYSFSKSLSLAGERIGYAAVNPDMVGANDVFAALCGAGRALGYICAPTLFQRVCAKCLGQSSDVSIYNENRKLLYGALTKMGFDCVKPEGAFYLFMKTPEPDAKAFCERAKKYELLLVPSDSFGVEGHVRISYCVKRETIERSLPAFEKLAKEYNL